MGLSSQRLRIYQYLHFKNLWRQTLKNVSNMEKVFKSYFMMKQLKLFLSKLVRNQEKFLKHI